MVTSWLPSGSNIISIKKQVVVYGECLKFLKTVPNNSIDIFVTSPPYNIGVKYGKYNDRAPAAEYFSNLQKVFNNIKRALKDDGSVFINVGSTNRFPWQAYDIANSLRNLLVLQNRIIWIKSISINDVTYGHFKPINSDRFVNNTYEEIFHFTKDGNTKINRLSIGVPYMDRNNIKRKGNTSDVRCRGNCWFVPYETIQSKAQKGGHPATFPEKLVETCIKLAGYNDSTIVCDPFLGSGTSLIVAERLGVKGIGIEMDYKYYEFACNRLINMCMV
jgi:site-specific DNA-methyltransferase (adenine-specific)